MITVILILAILGFLISLYAYFVESRIKKEPSYKPACDINDRISCSAPLKSEYSNLFYFSNSIMGMIYYFVVAALAVFNMGIFLLIATTGGLLLSLVLAYLLYFKIKALCLVCTSLYIINLLLFLNSPLWILRFIWG